MTPKQFVKAVLRTESKDEDAIKVRLIKGQTYRILHAAMGIATESGELLDAVKKYVFYGKDIDYVNINEEAGDLLWYLALLLDAIGVDFESVMDKNINKLKARYLEKFDNGQANNRDLEKERDILEKEE